MSLPGVIDLFSGCGGMALGFEKAGFKITYGVDIVPEAIKNISYNLFWRYGQDSSHIVADIRELDSKILDGISGEQGCIVIGGPPCQAYSIAGKGKLRSLSENYDIKSDPRGYLYKDLLRFAFGLNARAVVVENVPESVNFGGENIPQTICESLEENGYNAYWTILNSADYGVPQVRERIFVVGIKQNEKNEIGLPNPTHRNPSSNFTINDLRVKKFEKYSNFKKPLKIHDSVPKWVTVGDAISDLPELFRESGSCYSTRPLNVGIQYKTEIQSEYQNIMRSWYGEHESTVTANAFRKNKRDFKIFELMEQGDDYTDASKVADSLLEEYISKHNISEKITEDDYKRIKREIVPSSSRQKFTRKWKKLDMKKPSHTIVAHLGKDTYSHIHPLEPRGISVREAARLQSIPDDYFFTCSMGEAFRQIGNAVPPLLAKGVAISLRDCFEK